MSIIVNNFGHCGQLTAWQSRRHGLELSPETSCAASPPQQWKPAASWRCLSADLTYLRCTSWEILFAWGWRAITQQRGFVPFRDLVNLETTAECWYRMSVATFPAMLILSSLWDWERLWFPCLFTELCSRSDSFAPWFFVPGLGYETCRAAVS
jgi:hypothetical protein